MKASEKPSVIAHRGNRSLAPENTLLAAEAGFAAGADWWELDVAESSDGVLVVIHDDSLVRTTDAQLVFPGCRHDPAGTRRHRHAKAVHPGYDRTGEMRRHAN